MSQKSPRKQRTKNKLSGRLLNVAGSILLLAIAAFAVWQWGQIENEPPAGEANVGTGLGDVAPDFELTDMNGETVRLSDYRGRPVAVMFMHTW